MRSGQADNVYNLRVTICCFGGGPRNKVIHTNGMKCSRRFLNGSFDGYFTVLLGRLLETGTFGGQKNI